MTTEAIHYDPYDFALSADPYATYARLRDEAPLYFSEEHDFYALSRYGDVEAGLRDAVTYSSSRGNIIEFIKAGFEMPSGVVIYEDPPTHTLHRAVLSRVFTPKKMAALEDRIRQYCAACLDPVVGSGGFDLIDEVAAAVPMRTIGMLLGIPEDDQRAIRDRPEADMHTTDGQPLKVSADFASGAAFADYVDWRMEHPSDDLMTLLIAAEIDDGRGGTRRLERSEILTYVNVLAGAGNETTRHLIGWAGKVLADHPEQRRELASDPSLIPNAIEELLRFEPPAPFAARYVTRDVVLHGATVPEGSVMLFVIGAANRDDRRYDDGDDFDIHRAVGAHLTFGFGIHYCLGAALARLQGRIVLEELLERFPDWTVDVRGAQLAPSSTIRGWATLPMVLP
ncbi:cytochrome P450 [Dermatobacter hominis]|uniref:cytochrome P450 n=1 Tax=Dermatobacter hominis TaxID=2884263 RepID=UPI001D114C83|nr:cytochrome P450 [Dermatobacter hominis]UDY37650.1 cytochrome P450 [Dermatobacter hominis]